MSGVPKLPRWTVLYNIVSEESNQWVGTGWEFFDEESDAKACYHRHSTNGNCATKRPFCFKVDGIHLGPIHQLRGARDVT